MNNQPKAGETWITRSGHKGRVVDDKFKVSTPNRHGLVVAISDLGAYERVFILYEDGRLCRDREYPQDLVKKYEPPLCIVVRRSTGYVLTHALSPERAQTARDRMTTGLDARTSDDIVVVELKDFQLG